MVHIIFLFIIFNKFRRVISPVVRSVLRQCVPSNFLVFLMAFSLLIRYQHTHIARGITNTSSVFIRIAYGTLELVRREISAALPLSRGDMIWEDVLWTGIEGVMRELGRVSQLLGDEIGGESETEELENSLGFISRERGRTTVTSQSSEPEEEAVYDCRCLRPCSCVGASLNRVSSSRGLLRMLDGRMALVSPPSAGRRRYNRPRSRVSFSPLPSLDNRNIPRNIAMRQTKVAKTIEADHCNKASRNEPAQQAVNTITSLPLRIHQRSIPWAPDVLDTKGASPFTKGESADKHEAKYVSDSPTLGEHKDNECLTAAKMDGWVQTNKLISRASKRHRVSNPMNWMKRLQFTVLWMSFVGTLVCFSPIIAIFSPLLVVQIPVLLIVYRMAN
ncbi:uncharacterized protein VTP21DRAFT_3907 [Calcarisporiella thermophila]|uniref:uncharacterized protein n=1 Tax=Calcarisporiella thermophila TaxID=911321 RepID=UPI00374318EF